jgi:stage II sporulation protein D
MRLRSLRCLIALLALVVIASHLAGGGTPAPVTRSTLRIGLWTLWHDRQVNAAPAAGGSVSMRACSQSGAWTTEPLFRLVPIHADGNRLALPGNREAASVELSGAITLAAHGETLTLRNPVRITAQSGELVLSVTLPVESYVERVVASESGAADSPESLKALAVVVRSFALHQAHGHPDYDLCDSTHCQLLHWGGKPDPDAAQNPRVHSFPLFPAERAGNPAAHAATLATSGETLWYHGQRAQAWFHQNCGGRTATPAEIWPGNSLSRKPMPWLASRIDPYCTAGGAKEWSSELSLTELTSALAVQGLARPGWKNLTVARRGESGRAVTLKADGAEISAEDFRLAVGRALGWNRIPSTWFELSRDGDRFIFHGRGSGHGVGLCQAGAAVMAAGGHVEGQILEQYFPGAAAADEATGQIWQRLRGDGFALESLDAADAAYLPDLTRSLAEAESRSGLRRSGNLIVRAFRSAQAFRNGTLAPGWVAAFTEGDWIGTQPLATLHARRLLAPTMRHEFMHALVEEQAAPATPLWLREGLVEARADSNPRGADVAPAFKLDDVDRALAHAQSEAQSEAAHLAAKWYAAALLKRFGRDQAIAWLHSGVPASAIASIR